MIKKYIFRSIVISIFTVPTVNLKSLYLLNYRFNNTNEIITLCISYHIIRLLLLANVFYNYVLYVLYNIVSLYAQCK